MFEIKACHNLRNREGGANVFLKLASIESNAILMKGGKGGNFRG